MGRKQKLILILFESRKRLPWLMCSVNITPSRQKGAYFFNL